MKMRLSHILIVLTLISCEMVVDVDVPPPPELLVLNSTFDSEGNWSAKVSKNQYILDEDPPVFFNDATLTVTRPDGSSFSLETKPPSDDFFYDAYLYSYKDESVFYGEPYLISAEKEGFPIATSASVIPKPVQILLYEIDTTTFFDQQGLNTWNGDNKLSVTFQDVEGESFYGLRLKTMVLYYGFNYVGVVADKIRRGACGQQIPDKGFLPSANSGMTEFLGFVGVVDDKIRRGASVQQIPDKGLLSSAN
jgi:hypothetical protein